MGRVSDLVSQFNTAGEINKHLTWNDVGYMKVSGRQVRNAFLDARMVKLHAGMRLFKFNSYPSLWPDQQGNVSPWWSSLDEWSDEGSPHDIDPGWNSKLKLAKVLRCSIREYGRVTSAITEGWNSCEFKVTITLTTDIWVDYGRFKKMPRNDGGSQVLTAGKMMMLGRVAPSGFVAERKGFTTNLPGGGRQFFIPNLKKIYYKNETCESLLLSEPVVVPKK